jgi:hypothetical protein
MDELWRPVACVNMKITAFWGVIDTDVLEDLLSLVYMGEE